MQRSGAVLNLGQDKDFSFRRQAYLRGRGRKIPWGWYLSVYTSISTKMLINIDNYIKPQRK